MWVVEIVLAWVVIAAAALVVWSMLRGMERQRDDWKRVADELAEALRAEPEVVIGLDPCNWRAEPAAVLCSPPAARALARYNAMLEPEA